MPNTYKQDFLLCKALFYQILHEHDSRVEANNMAKQMINLVGEHDWIEAENRIAYMLKGMATEYDWPQGDIPENIFIFGRNYAKDSRC